MASCSSIQITDLAHALRREGRTSETVSIWVPSPQPRTASAAPTPRTRAGMTERKSNALRLEREPGARGVLFFALATRGAGNPERKTSKRRGAPSSARIAGSRPQSRQ